MLRKWSFIQGNKQLIPDEKMNLDIRFIESILSNEVVVRGFPLIYKGEMNHDITKLFTAMAETKISHSKKDKNLRMKVFHVMVECLQNISKHSDDFDDPEVKIGNGMFIVGETEDSYYVITGNVIQKHRTENLKEHIERLNTMNKEELDVLHKKQMREGVLTTRGGAGLGLIDIVRKTGQKLEYNFLDLNNDQKFFVLKVDIPT